VAKKVADSYDTADRDGPTRFDPPWRTSNSGQSCFVDRDKYVDLAEGNHGGGALKLVARAERNIDVNHSRHSVDGKDDYWNAVNRLREMGFDIPYFEGSNGMHPDFLGLYEQSDDNDAKRRKAAKALEL